MRIWRKERLSCLKRSTLGAYLLGTLSEEWQEYVEFHLEVAKCPYCQSNIDDIRSEEAKSEEAEMLRERVFQSSVGFLRRSRG